MIAKCNFCGNTFDAKRNTARFCSDLHRTLFGKLPDAEKEVKLKEIFPDLKSASEVPPPPPDKEKKNELTENEEIGIRFKDLAKAKKCSIEDFFIWIEENYGRKVDNAKNKPAGGKNEGNSGKHYIGNPKTKILIEPEENTNTFFMRYGAFTMAEVKKLKKAE